MHIVQRASHGAHGHGFIRVNWQKGRQAATILQRERAVIMEKQVWSGSRLLRVHLTPPQYGPTHGSKWNCSVCSPATVSGTANGQPGLHPVSAADPGKPSTRPSRLCPQKRHVTPAFTEFDALSSDRAVAKKNPSSWRGCCSCPSPRSLTCEVSPAGREQRCDTAGIEAYFPTRAAVCFTDVSR